MDDYSCYLQQSDISYNQNEHTKFFKLQLLAREDNKKWFVWSQFGKVGGSEQSGSTRMQEFFNRYDAMVEFENKFYEKTANKWKDREYFQQKPGKFLLIKR